MNTTQQMSEFAVGAVTIAANRDMAVRAEVLKVGDPVRVLIKPSYGEAKVHTGVIVGFEPFKEKPTIIIAYVEEDYSKAELKMLYFNGDNKDTEVLAAPADIHIGVSKVRVIDHFNAEKKKLLAQLDELIAKEKYFLRYFGQIMAQVAGRQREENEASDA